MCQKMNSPSLLKRRNNLIKLNSGQQSRDILGGFQETNKIIYLCVYLCTHLSAYLSYAYLIGHLLFLILLCGVI